MEESWLTNSWAAPGGWPPLESGRGFWVFGWPIPFAVFVEKMRLLTRLQSRVCPSHRRNFTFLNLFAHYSPPHHHRSLAFSWRRKVGVTEERTSCTAAVVSNISERSQNRNYGENHVQETRRESCARHRRLTRYWRRDREAFGRGWSECSHHLRERSWRGGFGHQSD